MLDQLGRRRFEQLQEVRVLMGQYTWTQLTEWYGSIEQDMLTMPAVDLLTVDSRKNRLTIEVRTVVNDAAEKEIEAVLSDREVSPGSGRPEIPHCHGEPVAMTALTRLVVMVPPWS